jgi:AcrR family transcriptional regulator
LSSNQWEKSLQRQKRGLKRGPGRPPRGKEHDRHLLLDAAMRCFAEQGFEAASLRTIAARARVDVSLISYHYGSKLGLWEAIIAQEGADTVARLVAFVAENEGSRDAELADRLARFIIDMVRERPQFAQLMIGELMLRADENRGRIIGERLVGPVLGLIQPLVQRLGPERTPQESRLAIVSAVSLTSVVIASGPQLDILPGTFPAGEERLDGMRRLVGRILFDR